MDSLTQDTLRELISYNPVDGVFKWRTRDGKWFASDHDCNKWNGRYAGKKAGSTNSQSGRYIICIDYKNYKAHRLAFLYVHGYMPKEVGHYDQTPSNNKISNLMDVSRQENMKNLKMRETNTSGVMGVCWHKIRGAWMASIYAQQKPRFIGYFDDFFEAVCARKSAEVVNGYHVNHGNHT